MTSTQAMDLRDPERIERPAVLEMSFEEFIDWDHQGGLAEWVDGKVYLCMSNTKRHQQIVNFLQRFLAAFCELAHPGALVTTAPYAMRATPFGPAREPDVVVVLDGQAERVGNRYLSGPADVVVEVMSEGSVDRDRFDKFDEYEAAGVREYWLIDSRAGHERADFFVLGPDPLGIRERVYVPTALDGSSFHSRALEGCRVDVRWLFDESASPLRCLAEVVGRERMAELLG
ncbi:MAG: Uma2 family endonuclease [Dehalococcoidia bacterium]|nr:Uma2 family endonuclease [Dehalococcoidia bacterium]